jgi:diadenylate cyclase
MASIQTYWEQALRALGFLKLTDVLDILIFAFLVYKIILLVQSTSAARVAKGICVLVLLTVVASFAKMRILYFLLNQALEIGILAIVILFQPELRRILERMGSGSLREWIEPKKARADVSRVISQTVAACETMSREKVGVLMVFERNTPLEEYFKTGTVIDATVSAELLKNIFFPKAALHDGAVIVRDGRVAAAGCVLPLSDNPGLSRDLGTRHRAGIGVSEVSDGVVVIVSEETGTISVAVGGMLKRHLAPQTLEQLLIKELGADPAEPPKGLLGKIRNRNQVSKHEKDTKDA